MASRVDIYRRLAFSRIRGHAQYRISFSLQVAGAFLLSFLDFVAIVVMFQHIHSLDDWTVGEIAFLYGTSYIIFKFADILMTNMDRLPLFVRMGSFDQVLTRPLGTLGQVMTADIDIRHIGGMTQGAVVMWFGLQRIDIDWTPDRIALFPVMLLSGLAIYCAIWVGTNAITFWTMDAREVANSFTYGGNFLTQFPLSVYGVWMRRILGYGFALGFVNYFPSLHILGKDTGHPTWLSFISPAVALGLSVVAGSVWRTAVRHYRSTGS